MGELVVREDVWRDARRSAAAKKAAATRAANKAIREEMETYERAIPDIVRAEVADSTDWESIVTAWGWSSYAIEMLHATAEMLGRSKAVRGDIPTAIAEIAIVMEVECRTDCGIGRSCLAVIGTVMKMYGPIAKHDRKYQEKREAVCEARALDTEAPQDLDSWVEEKIQGFNDWKAAQSDSGAAT